MGPHLIQVLMRPYRPRQPWQDDVELIWAAAALIVLIVLLVWGVREHLRQAKTEKRAALDRVRSKRCENGAEVVKPRCFAMPFNYLRPRFAQAHYAGVGELSDSWKGSWQWE